MTTSSIKIIHFWYSNINPNWYQCTKVSLITEIDDNDVMSQELQRLWNTGESIMEAVKDEDILQLTNILLKEIVHGFQLIFSPNIDPSNENPEISYVMSSSSMNTYVTGKINFKLICRY